MAVQAQYPSNILLLNRNGQEGHDYSLQPQGGGFLDHQSHLLFNNGVVRSNPRKRGREGAAAATDTTPTPTPTPPPPPPTTTAAAAAAGRGAIRTPIAIQQQQQHNNNNNLLAMQPPPPQLIDVSQLHNNQSQNVVSTGLRLSFNNNNQQQQQQQNYVSHSSAFLSIFAAEEDISNQIKLHRQELDHFLQAQAEQLRRTLAEKRQKHYHALLRAAEESITRRLREKEAEVEKAARRNAELEARAAQLSIEAQLWQAKARAQEATAASLQAQLQQAIMSGGGMTQDSRRGDNGLGCAGAAEGQVEDAESAYIDPERVSGVLGGPSCKACRKRAASVVLLPCRHLCLCTECDQVAQACPLCFQLRYSTLEVFPY